MKADAPVSGDGGLRRELSLVDATMINVGSMIGSGIFLVPAVVATHLDTPGPVLLAWLVGGVVSLLGGLAIAELGAAIPRSGGLVVYLSRAFGPIWGFLYGWSAFMVSNTAAIAAIAVAFATYAGFFVPLGATAVKVVAIAAVAALTIVNCLGVKLGAMANNLLSGAKLVALGGIVAGALLLPGGSAEHFAPFWTTGDGFVPRFGLAMVAVLWTYEGWISLPFVGGEVREPQRNIGRAMGLSIVLVTAFYLAVNAAILYVLPLGAAAGADLAMSDAARVTMGATGATLVAAAVVIATLSAAHVNVLTCARVPFAMARDGSFFAWAGRIHPRWATPVPALVAQGVLACAFIATGSFGQLITYVVVVAFVFYGLGVVAMMRLRRTEPALPRPYRTWGHPVTPILFLIFAAGLVANTVAEAPRDAVIGLAIVLAGLPLYRLVARRDAA